MSFLGKGGIIVIFFFVIILIAQLKWSPGKIIIIKLT